MAPEQGDDWSLRIFGVESHPDPRRDGIRFPLPTLNLGTSHSTLPV